MIRPELWGWSSTPLSTYAWGWDEVGAVNVLMGIPRFVLDRYILHTSVETSGLRLMRSTTGIKIIRDSFAPSVVRCDDKAKNVKETYLQKTLKTETGLTISQEDAVPLKVCHADVSNHFSATKTSAHIAASNSVPKTVH